MSFYKVYLLEYSYGQYIFIVSIPSTFQVQRYGTLEYSITFSEFNLLISNEQVQSDCLFTYTWSPFPALIVYFVFVLLAWYIIIEGPRSNQSSSPTGNNLKLYRPSHENLPASYPTPFSYSSSVYNSSISLKDQGYKSSIDKPRVPQWEVKAEDILRNKDL